MDDVEKLINQHGYWNEHPDYPSEDWRYHIANCETRQGYWEWVESNIANED